MKLYDFVDEHLTTAEILELALRTRYLDINEVLGGMVMGIDAESIIDALRSMDFEYGEENDD